MILGTGLFMREIKSIIFAMVKIRIKRNEAGEGINLNFYNVTFSIWIRPLEIMIDINIVKYVLND